jgi:outer membrane protein insertion porin family
MAMESSKQSTSSLAIVTARPLGKLASLCVAMAIVASTGCAMQQQLSTSRGNNAFKDLVGKRFDQSHPVAQSKHLAALTKDIEPKIEETITTFEETTEQVRAQSPDNTSGFNQASQISSNGNSGSVQRTAYQYPGSVPQDAITPNFGQGFENIGSPNELNSAINPYAIGGNAGIPPGQNYADLDVFVGETQTGSINIGGAYNSDNGIVGQFVIDERNFDIRAFPRSFRELIDGTAFRGGGQAFRLELVPGEQVQRYLLSFSEPYLFGTNYSLSLSGYLFDRRYEDWDEQRLGGRISIGRRLTPDLSFNVGLRMEDVDIDPNNDNSPTLNNTPGGNLFLFNAGIIRDTRDHPFLATEGSYLAATYTQGFGDFSYPRGDLEYRRYRLMYERPDGSGRHTVSFGTKLGFSGSETPIFENYFAGGFSTLRGYEFRGAAPAENGVRIGGEFQWLNTVEYMFPITADDMIKGVAFCDFGTVEESIELNGDNFRVAPGVGLRIHMPALGGGAPLAFDFAFPVSSAEGDEEKVFSFYISANR